MRAVLPLPLVLICLVVAGPAPARSPIDVRLDDRRVVASEKLRFEANKAVLHRRSAPIIARLAAFLQEHPELTRIVVEGHGDGTLDRY